MGLMDNLKARLEPAKDKVSGLAQQHGHKVTHGLDKAAKVVDEKTKHKYSGKIQTGTGKAKDAMDRLAHKDGGGTTPPPDMPTPPRTS
ncbi:antitoxin [Streptomyces sp. NPDC002688]|uniref:antitoxin n=1 Tax=Streptomyces sp. NPDC002688 TaxID=3154423 RepID=UPI003317D288